MAQTPGQMIHRDPQLFYWILLPITIVMIVTGVLRHYATVLMATSSKKVDSKTMKEQHGLVKGVSLRNNHHVLSTPSFLSRRNTLVTAFQEGKYLQEPRKAGQSTSNPMSDPNAMEGMMGMMKNNMAMIIPNTLIMSWINASFSGYVIMKLPFPLTIKFKSMLQAGVATRDMDPRWMSSISWYFLCIFGLQTVFNFLLGSNAANQMTQQMSGTHQVASNPFAPGQDPNKQFIAEVENLAVIEHYSTLENVEDRLLGNAQ